MPALKTYHFNDSTLDETPINQYFIDTHPVDATVLQKDFLVATITPAALKKNKPLELISKLFYTQIIGTYVHVEATVQLDKEQNSKHNYSAWFSASHIYFTNDRNEVFYKFMVSVDKITGKVILNSI